MAETTVETENFGFLEDDIQPNYSSDDEFDENATEKNNGDKDLTNDSKKCDSSEDDICVKCENKFKRIGGGVYDGLLSYCNDCHTNDKENIKVVDNTVDTVRSFLLQMSTLNSADHIASFRENSYRLDKTASETKSTRFFICIETRQEKLYWYNQYSAFLPHQMPLFFLVRCPMELLV